MSRSYEDGFFAPIIHSRNPAAISFLAKGVFIMEKSNSQQETQTIIPIIDKYTIIKSLQSLIRESRDIAGYIDDNVNYGRALGYAEGKHAAYLEIVGRVLDGEFDPAFYEEEIEHDYEM
jgi:hypothetical protein